MKKLNVMKKVIVFLLMIGTLTIAFTGCQNKSAQNDSNQSSNNKKQNADEMKKKMQDNINSLVTDGTITQAQSDKVLEALTANAQGNRSKKSQNDKQNQQNDQSQANDQNRQKNNGQGNRQNNPRNNALNKLISDGVITQAQADAVMKKIRGNFTRPQNNQSS